MGYIPDAVLDEIRSDPSRVVEYYNTYRAQFISDLNLPPMDEAALQAAWCSVVAYNLAPYGPVAAYDLNTLMASPTLECSGYVTLTWYLISEFGISTEDQAAIGWYDGAVGNHAQMLVSVNGTNLLLDPTIGLVAFGVTLNGLINGTHYDVYTSFYHRNDLDSFHQTVVDALADGQYRIQDIIYHAPSFDAYHNHYAEHLGFVLDHGNDSQTVVGLIEADVLDAGVGNDFIYGGRGDDTIIGGPGSDFIDGGPDFDRVTYHGARSTYSLEYLGGNNYRITDLLTSDVDLLTAIDRFDFLDQSIAGVAGSTTTMDSLSQFAWENESRAFDLNGNLISISYQMDDGSGWLYSYDTLNVWSWMSETRATNSTGTPTSIFYQLDDGSNWLYSYDALDQFNWKTLETICNSNGTPVRILYEQDDGKRVNYRYDIDGNANWDRIVTYYESDWTVSLHQYTQDDGSTIVYEYDFSNVKSWACIITYLDQASNVSCVTYDQDDGTKVIYEYDLQSNVWDRIVTKFDTNGHVNQITYDQDDGTQIQYHYDVENLQHWTTQTLEYRSSGSLAKNIVDYDNETHSIAHYDENGLLVAQMNYTHDWILI